MRKYESHIRFFGESYPCDQKRGHHLRLGMLHSHGKVWQVRYLGLPSHFACIIFKVNFWRVYKSAKKSYSRRVSYAADLIAGQEEEQNPQALTDLCRCQMLPMIIAYPTKLSVMKCILVLSTCEVKT